MIKNEQNKLSLPFYLLSAYQTGLGCFIEICKNKLNNWGGYLSSLCVFRSSPFIWLFLLIQSEGEKNEKKK